VVIEEGVWIGAHAIILKGARIGKGSIIGAGAVVSGEIPPMSIAAGNPAKVVKKI
jgi:acetyltransferase-like isoleucine patch superfamily enzyme